MDRLLRSIPPTEGGIRDDCDVHELVGQLMWLLYTFSKCLIRGLATKRAMGSSEVVEAFPFGQFLVQINIVDIVEQLIELSRSVRCERSTFPFSCCNLGLM